VVSLIRDAHISTRATVSQCFVATTREIDDYPRFGDASRETPQDNRKAKHPRLRCEDSSAGMMPSVAGQGEGDRASRSSRRCIEPDPSPFR